ncbi:MAG: hypothetical protein Q7T82_18490 [Armatimonadota bacterium]|nr:hypothetical protein [Armatimonadota bacterium]
MKQAKCILALAVVAIVLQPAPGQCKETFDKDPKWDGHNNHIARELPPVTVRQDFGYSSNTAHAGGEPGEIGGTIQPAREPAYYAKPIQTKTLNDRLTASGKLLVARGSSNTLLGFFNDKTLNEWRTPNTIVIRINSRGETYEAHVEYTSQKWRASAGIIGRYDAVTDRNHPLELTCGVMREWSLEYDPAGNNGSGSITFTLAGEKALINLIPDLRRDGATFNRFGLLNVMKSYDGAGDLWLDDLSIDGEAQDFSRDPQWKGLRNRGEYTTAGVRPRFDFGFSPTHYAGGKAKGELGGVIYRGDCRYPERMACYGDRLKTLTLDHPLRASGKVAMRRGVSDSTSAIGFYNSIHSMAVTDSQQFGTPRDFLGVYIEGPSREGFYFYPVYRNQLDGTSSGYPNDRPRILPDGSVHDWTLVYDPAAAQGNGRITVTLDGQSAGIDLAPGVKASGATFDRFGIVTTWIDGNAQEVYFDDLEYTSR